MSVSITELFNRLKKTELWQVSFFSAISTIVKLLVSFLLGKVISIYLGPSGLGVIGQLTSFLAIIVVLSTGATNTGLVKYISEFKNQKDKYQSLIKAALVLSFSCTLIISISLLLFSAFWVEKVFLGHTEYTWILVVLSFSLVFQSIYSLFLSILNGLKEFKVYNYLTIWASVLSLIFTAVLIYLYQLEGALLALITYQAIVCILLVFNIRNINGLDLKGIVKSKFGIKEFKMLSNYSLMALVSSIALPISQIFIRNYLNENSSANAMGLYEGINRISFLYLSAILTTFSIYYLPKLSELKNVQLLRREIFKGYQFILPITFLILLIVYFFRSLIITFVLSTSFSGIEDYFLPQVIGDFFKISSWLLAYLMIAKAMVKQYILTELIFSLFIVLFSRFCVDHFGGIGAIYAYAINYFLYLLTMLFLFRRLIAKGEMK